MTAERVTRRLAAILAADVVGYSRLMGRDEHGTLTRLKVHRTQRLEPTLVRHGGRLVKLTGDGALVEFPSAVDALGAAIEFQQAMAEANRDQPEDMRIVFRIGLHLGDLIVDGDDLYGEGVNVAARLEAEAPAGGVLISGDVHNAVMGRLKAAFDDLGKLALKNIERPIQAFGVGWDAADWKVVATTVATPSIITTPSSDVPLVLPDKPSIAVLPFQNMSGDPEQEYFADGMTEDILTALSRFQNLFVIARNSSFTYKGRSVDIKHVGKELGVRYVLEGSIRAAGNRVRITAQLIDATSGHHVWADRYDRALTDIFAVQDEVTAHIVAAIDFEVRAVEAQRPRGSATAGLDAWALYHKAFPLLFRLTDEENSRAVKLFDELRTSHPNLAVAHAGYGYARGSEVIYGWTSDRAASARSAIAPCRKAVELDDKDAFCHLALGRALMLAGDHELALAPFERAVARNPNSALAHLFRGVSLKGLDRDTEALAEFDLAIRLSPRDPGLWSFHFWLGRCQRDLGDLDAAVRSFRQAIAERPDVWFPHLDLGTTLAKAGRMVEAEAAVAKVRALKPDVTLDAIAYLDSLFASPRRVDENQRLAAALGIPKAIVHVGAAAGSLAPPDKPSIAVLPFQNMSGDPEQEYFTDGIVEDIITELSRFRELLVIARNSTFIYKGKPVNVGQVARELGVRYVLEGSSRKAGNRVRITAQLIDVGTGGHIWAERYDRELSDIFLVQEQVTRAIVQSLIPAIETSALARIRRRAPANLTAEELAMRAWAESNAAYLSGKRELREAAAATARQALALDTQCVRAWTSLALLAWQEDFYSGGQGSADRCRSGLEAARRAIALDRLEHRAYMAKGLLLLRLREYDEALADLRHACELNPSDAVALNSLAWGEVADGDGRSAREHLLQYLRLSPRDPARFNACVVLANACWLTGDYAEGLLWIAESRREQPDFPPAISVGIKLLVAVGQIDKARLEAEGVPRVRELVRAGISQFRRLADREHELRLLRLAFGLPEPASSQSGDGTSGVLAPAPPDQPSVVAPLYQNMSRDSGQE